MQSPHAGEDVVGSPYIWQSPHWPNHLTWDEAALADGRDRARLALGRLRAKGALLGLHEREDLHIESMGEEAQRTARIEGERLDRDSVRSSVRRHLGKEVAGLGPRQRAIDGLVDVLMDATGRPEAPLSRERLFGWHAALFPTGWSGMTRITVGAYRSGPEPMRIVTTALDGPTTVHFQAPPSASVAADMERFLEWAEADGPPTDGLLRAGLAHLWFETIHPFDDGNGRVGRAIADLLLSRVDPTRPRLWSLSAAIDDDRAGYYRELRAAQRSDGDVTPWLAWFLDRVHDGIVAGEERCDRALSRVRFWQHHGVLALNERQAKIVERMLAAGPDGFEGGMTTRKAASLTRSSKPTAQRDLADLVARGVLRAGEAGGRSTAYQLIYSP